MSPGRASDDPVGCWETAISPGVLWSRSGSGGTEGVCFFPSDLAMQKLRGGGRPFHLQCGIWHRNSSWGWDAEWQQNKFIWKELLCPDNSPIGRRVKLCIYMQCGGLARLLSGLWVLSWLDFNMTDSHQVQTQMGDVGILPREDRNSSWHSESCTGDGHFTEAGVKPTVAQCEGVQSVEETLFPWENIIASPERRCLLQAGSPRSCLAKLLHCHGAAEAAGNLVPFFHTQIRVVLCCCQGTPGSSADQPWRSHFTAPWNAGAHHMSSPKLCPNPLSKWMFRVDFITALQVWVSAQYSLQVD